MTATETPPTARDLADAEWFAALEANDPEMSAAVWRHINAPGLYSREVRICRDCGLDDELEPFAQVPTDAWRCPPCKNTRQNKLRPNLDELERKLSR